MASGGLSSFRDALLTASFFDVIDDDEFVLLYDAYSSKPIFPYWKFPRLSVDEWSDVECETELRFAKKHLPELCECLGIPEKITCVQRTVCGGMEGLCILLKRLAYPCRYTDMVPRFGRNPTELCLIFNTMIDFIYGNHKHRLNVLVLH